MGQLILITFELQFLKLKWIPLAWPFYIGIYSLLHLISLLGQESQSDEKSWLEKFIKIFGIKRMNKFPININKSWVLYYEAIVWGTSDSSSPSSYTLLIEFILSR